MSQDFKSDEMIKIVVKVKKWHQWILIDLKDWNEYENEILLFSEVIYIFQWKKNYDMSSLCYWKFLKMPEFNFQLVLVNNDLKESDLRNDL